jgi:Zn-dependent protease with chaperone function
LCSSAFEHPADRQALEALRKIPGLDKLIRKMLELGVEKMMRVQLLGGAVHITPKQCPRVYKLFKEACDILDVHEPDLFLASSPVVNAYTFGVERPFVVIQSGLVDLLDDEELMAVMGHELGHVKAGHVLYRSLALILIRLIDQFIPIRGLANIALQIALFDWYRKSEMTADRAELLVAQDVDICLRVHMKLSAGSKTVFQQMSTQEFLRQADSYEEMDYSSLNKIYKILQELFRSHPIPVYRAKEIKQWSETKAFKEILAGRYPTNEQEVNLRTCPHCSSKIAPSFFFCPDCGKNVRI